MRPPQILELSDVVSERGPPTEEAMKAEVGILLDKARVILRRYPTPVICNAAQEVSAFRSSEIWR